MKDPSAGALQPTSPTLWGLAANDKDRQLSIALGELHDVLSTPALTAAPRIPTGIRFAKLGLSAVAQRPGWHERWLDWADQIAASATPVAVAYADWQSAGAPSPETVLEAATAAPFGAFLIDTFDKRLGGLFDHLAEARVKSLVNLARSVGLVTVLGGSLRKSTLPQAVACEPDVIAVRGAACDGQRHEGLSAARVCELQQLLEQCVRTPSY